MFTSGLEGVTSFVLGASGDIAGVINPASRNAQPLAGQRPTGAADEWLAGATDVPGNRWPHWSAWLARHAGPKVSAPKAPVRVKCREIETAPGRYVKDRA